MFRTHYHSLARGPMHSWMPLMGNEQQISRCEEKVCFEERYSQINKESESPGLKITAIVLGVLAFPFSRSSCKVEESDPNINMGRLTAILFLVELTFTVFKSLFQILSPTLTCAITFCFVTESLVGAFLAGLLAYSALKSEEMLTRKEALVTGVALVCVAEIMTICTEFRHLLAVTKRVPAAEANRGRKRRKAMKWLSFIVGIFAPVSAIIILQHSKTTVPFAEALMGGCIVANFFIMAHGYSATDEQSAATQENSAEGQEQSSANQEHLRVVTCLLFFSVGTAVALVIQFGGWLSDQGKEFSFDSWIVPALFCSPIASMCTAIAAWSLRNIREERTLKHAHAEVFEVAAVGLTGPAVVLGFAIKNGLSVRNIFLTVFPQVGAVLFPFFVSYFVHCLARLFAKFARFFEDLYQ